MPTTATAQKMTLPELLAKFDRSTPHRFPAPAVYVANPAFWPSPAPLDIAGDKITLEKMQFEVGGLIEFVALADGWQIVVNEDGLLAGLPFNPLASYLATLAQGSPAHLVGNALLIHNDRLK